MQKVVSIVYLNNTIIQPYLWLQDILLQMKEREKKSHIIIPWNHEASLHIAAPILSPHSYPHPMVMVAALFPVPFLTPSLTRLVSERYSDPYHPRFHFRRDNSSYLAAACAGPAVDTDTVPVGTAAAVFLTLEGKEKAAWVQPHHVALQRTAKRTTKPVWK